MATITKLGTFLLDGAPTDPGGMYTPGQTIGFGDGQSLSWVVVNGLLIVKGRLMNNVSWDDLNKQGLVFGKQVSINGIQFLCRLLKVGAKKNEPNEWDAALDVIDGNLIWAWLTFDWGQEGSSRYRVLRGGGSPRTWHDAEFDVRFRNYGYRPALELLPSEQLALGNRVCAIGGQSILYGTLLEATDYDLLIQPEQSSMLADADAGNLFSKQPDGTVAIVRSKMIVQGIR